MNRFCSKCGNAINPNQRYCHICGNEHVYQDPNAVNNLPNNYQPYPGALPLPGMRRPKHVNYLFVTYLVYMIIFAFRVLTSFGSLSSMIEVSGALDSLSNDARDVTVTLYALSIVGIILTLLLFGGLLTGMLISISAKKRETSIASKKRSARLLIFFAIILLILAITYTIVEIGILVTTYRFIDIFGVTEELEASLINTAITSLVFDFTLIGILIGAIVKSLAFKKYLEPLE